MKPKQILFDCFYSFCPNGSCYCTYISKQNLRKIHKLSGLFEDEFYNGIRSDEQLRDMLIDAISDEQAKEIINQMPFPFYN